MTAMTTLTGPLHKEERDVDLRPVPWRRMAWVTWRQHRVALTGMVVRIGRDRGVHVDGRPATSPRLRGRARLSPCGLRWLPPANRVASIAQAAFLTNGWILQLVPALIGAFVGAPVLAREMETGTYRYAWTQGFGRWRWALAKLVGLAVAVTAAAGAISVLFSWYYQPYFGADNQARNLSEMSSPSPPVCSTCAGSRSAHGRWLPSPSASWPAA